MMDKPERKLVVGEVFIAPRVGSPVVFFADDCKFASCVFFGFVGFSGINLHLHRCSFQPFVRERTIDCGPELLGRRN